MRFVGPPFTFGFSMLASNISIIGPNAIVTVGDQVFWMDRENFYVYTGRVQVIPCTLLRYVFDDINLDQSFKCFAAFVVSGNTVRCNPHMTMAVFPQYICTLDCQVAPSVGFSSALSCVYRSNVYTNQLG